MKTVTPLLIATLPRNLINNEYNIYIKSVRKS